MLKAYATWLSKPNQDLISVMFVGVGNSVIALRYLLQGQTVICYLKSGEFYSTLREYKFLWINCDAISSTDINQVLMHNWSMNYSMNYVHCPFTYYQAYG